MIKVKHSGSFKNTEKFLDYVKNHDFYKILDKYGKMGVEALALATPKRTGLTSQSWNYEISREKDGYTLTWTNSNIQNGQPIALLIQFGHGLKGGGYVRGRDYINPALQSVFEKMAEEAWKEVTSA